MAEPSEKDMEEARDVVLTPRIERLPCGHFGDHAAIIRNVALAIDAAREEGGAAREASIRSGVLAEIRDFLYSRGEKPPLRDGDLVIALARVEGRAREEGRRAGLEEAAAFVAAHWPAWESGDGWRVVEIKTAATRERQALMARAVRALIGGDPTDAERARRNQQVAIGLDAGRDGMSDCTGCTDPRSEGTHQMGTRQHPTGGGK